MPWRWRLTGKKDTHFLALVLLRRYEFYGIECKFVMYVAKKCNLNCNIKSHRNQNFEAMLLQTHDALCLIMKFHLRQSYFLYSTVHVKIAKSFSDANPIFHMLCTASKPNFGYSPSTNPCSRNFPASERACQLSASAIEHQRRTMRYTNKHMMNPSDYAQIDRQTRAVNREGYKTMNGQSRYER